ncbi:MAG: TolC family protein [Candidatus Omnitrophica bacterium]|nr:TolC family protein [Candidatus Omnitrophota bacterium]MDE2230929.1 TolC family protein [Candidatus Omnitrophota bacterium]
MNKTKIFTLVFLSGCFAGPLMARQGPAAPLRLTLEKALQSADTINLQVLMANARVEQAIARIAESQADLLPHFDGTVSGGRQTADLRSEGLSLPGLHPHVGPYNNFDARPRVTMAIFDFSALARFQAARKGEKLSEAESGKTREDVLALVADLFIDAQRKQQTVKLLQALLARDRMAYGLSQESLSQGTGTQLDTSKDRSDLEQTQYLLAQAGQQAQDACLDLEAALQIPLGRALVFVDDNDFLKAMEKSAQGNSGARANADVVMATWQLESLKADQKTAYADFLPKISGSAEYGRAGASPERGSNTYDVGLTVSVPIWEGGRTQARLKEARAQVKEARENLEDATQQQEVNIAKARAAIEEADDLRQAKAQQRRTAQRSLLIALQARQVGSGTVLAVVQAKAQLALAEDDDHEARAAWIMAYIDLLHAQGGLRKLVNFKEEE